MNDASGMSYGGDSGFLHCYQPIGTARMPTSFKRISIAEYLQNERSADFKSEYYDGEIFAMAGWSPSHSLTAANVSGEARQLLKGYGCQVFNSGLRVKVSKTDLYIYPDATIVCGELQFDDEVRDTLLNPTVLIVVLSESTERYDRGRKSRHYRKIPSLKVLVLVSQEEYRVEWYTRKEDNSWLLQERTDLDQSLNLEPIGIQLPLTEIYRGVVLQPCLIKPTATE
ncbi:MAG: Uma2 family endonuclease [Pirellula sp.]|nr:Uma2 family endonuclease [Pirellula sp.]